MACASYNPSAFRFWGNMMVDKKFSTVVKILKYQFLTVLLITAGFVIAGGWQQGLSPALGGGAAFIPNIYFALRVMSTSGQEARKIINSFYAGESGKLLLTAALFIIIFQIPNIKVLPLITGYTAVLSVFWFALLMR
jgi:ATP synthase protein I